KRSRDAASTRLTPAPTVPVTGHEPRTRRQIPPTTKRRYGMERKPPHSEAPAVTAIRSPAVAGTFYPAEPAVLREQIAGFLAEADNAPPTGSALPKAIIGPHAGYVYSGPV